LRKTEESRPCDDTEVEKPECIMHMRKTVGSCHHGLHKDYKVKKLDDGKFLTVQGRLMGKEIIYRTSMDKQFEVIEVALK
jgi:hypothetical protein